MVARNVTSSSSWRAGRLVHLVLAAVERIGARVDRWGAIEGLTRDGGHYFYVADRRTSRNLLITVEYSEKRNQVRYHEAYVEY